MNCRHATSRGTGGAAAPPDFGGSEGAACPAARPITTGPPGFLTLGASLICYIQLVSFQTKKIWENETYFHYLSERLQLLHLRGNPCLKQVEKFYLLFSSRTCLGLRPELHL